MFFKIEIIKFSRLRKYLQYVKILKYVIYIRELNRNQVVLNHKTYHILRYNAENISEHVHALLFMKKLYENIKIIDNKYTYTHLYILLHHILKY